MINLFKSHYRAKDPESQKINPGGNGLGLYISKLIAVNLGGNLTVESTQGKGTVFYFELKLNIVYGIGNVIE